MQSDKPINPRKYWPWTILAVLAILAGCGRAPVTAQGTDEPGPLHPGDVVNVVESKGIWPCASTKEALDELIKWNADRQEHARVMRQTHSLGLSGGERVKVRDMGFGTRKIRILGIVEDGKLQSIDESGRECWTVREALR